MLPYTVEKIQGRDTRVPWPKDKANVALQALKKEAIRELQAIECSKAETMGIAHRIRETEDGDKIVCPVFATDGEGGQVSYRVDPIASSIKHSGAEATDLTREKWVELCSEPRSHGMVSQPALYTRKAGVGKIEIGKISPITATPMDEASAPKRGRGRPRLSDKL